VNGYLEVTRQEDLVACCRAEVLQFPEVIFKAVARNVIHSRQLSEAKPRPRKCEAGGHSGLDVWTAVGSGTAYVFCEVEDSFFKDYC
jgi:hypothetical protein